MNSRTRFRNPIATRPSAIVTPFVLFLSFMSLVSFAVAAGEFAIEQRDDRLVITHEGAPVAHYVFRDAKILRPYFAHVHTPDGIQVTRNHPPAAGTDPADHDTMHPGIWLAFGDISGQDFWRNKATIRHERVVEPPTIREGKLTFATESALIGTNAQMLTTLVSRFTLQDLAEGYLLIWDASFTPVTNGFWFGDQEEMGFGVRVATAISEKAGGTILSSAGTKAAKESWGKVFDWCDYSGVISNRLVGLTVMPDPVKNFRRSWFHNRDYGLMVANPFGQKAFTKREPSIVPVKRGETFHLQFTAFIHSTATNNPSDLDAVYRTVTSGK